MFKKIFVITLLLLLFLSNAFANESGWIYYGKTTAGETLYYNSELVKVSKDVKDDSDMVSVWIAIVNPSLGYSDRSEYIAFKKNPVRFAVLSEVKNNRNGDILKIENYASPEWETTEDANLMEFLYQQVAPFAMKNNISTEISKAYGKGESASQPSEQKTSKERANAPASTSADASEQVEANYIGNANTLKLHVPGCKWEKRIAKVNRVYFSSKEEAIEQGYTPCKICM